MLPPRNRRHEKLTSAVEDRSSIGNVESCRDAMICWADVISVAAAAAAAAHTGMHHADDFHRKL